MPYLSDYYGAPTAQAPDFLQRVKAAVKAARPKISDFNRQDADQTLRYLGGLDPTFSRTVKLLNKEPRQVRYWVARVTEKAFNDMLMLQDVDPDAASILARFEQFLLILADDLLGEAGRKRERAQNLLRLIVPWVVEKGNLKLEDALPLIGQAKRSRTKSFNLRQGIRKLLYSAPVSQLVNLSLIGVLYDKALKEERRARLDAFAALADMREREALSAANLEETRAELCRVNMENTELTDRIKKIEIELQGEKELRTYDYRQSMARSRGFLLERLIPLLEDAKDALNFKTPHIEGSLQRLDMAHEAIKQELRRFDD